MNKYIYLFLLLALLWHAGVSTCHANTSCDYDVEESVVPGLFHSSNIKDKDTLILTHNAGFFSCCTIKLSDIINYFNYYKKTPKIVDSSNQFSWYKNEDHTDVDITCDYFKNNETYGIMYHNDVDFVREHQFSNYKILDYLSIRPFIDKYFCPSVEIENRINYLESKYEIESYDKLCVLFYRGNDKITETRLCEYSEIIDKAKLIKNENQDIVFLIQSDETEFIERMLLEFPDSFYFRDEIRHMNKCNSTVDKVFKNQNYESSKFYLAITIIMSKCNYIVCGSSGNCSLWIMLYRNNANNVYQYLNGSWIH